jgi:hypothetical protein
MCRDSRAFALSTHPAETGTPSIMSMTSAARPGGTFPYEVSKTAAPFSARLYDTGPACAPGDGPATVAVRQHGHCRPGSDHSVTVFVTCTSTTCAQPGAAGAASSRLFPQRRHCAGGYGPAARAGPMNR